MPWGGVSGTCRMEKREEVLTRPSKMPSPVVAQLGSTFQTWSLAILSNCRPSDTSFGRMADGVSLVNIAELIGTYLLAGPACLRILEAAHPSFPGLG